MDSNSLQFFLAQGGGTQTAPQPWTMLPMLVLMVVMIGFMFFSQSKKAKQHAAMLKTIKAGDKVICSKYAGTEVKLDDKEYLIVRQSDILAVVE